jgi:hypothetical protein
LKCILHIVICISYQLVTKKIFSSYVPSINAKLLQDKTPPITYSITQQLKPPNSSKCLGTTNTSYKFSFSSLLSKEPAYVVLTSDSEVSSTSFLHVRALCPVLPQFPQCRKAGWAVSWSILPPGHQALIPDRGAPHPT